MTTLDVEAVGDLISSEAGERMRIWYGQIIDDFRGQMEFDYPAVELEFNDDVYDWCMNTFNYIPIIRMFVDNEKFRNDEHLMDPANRHLPMSLIRNQALIRAIFSQITFLADEDAVAFKFKWM